MIGLALSGGGAKGDFEVGVVRFLSDQGIAPNIIASTSVGSVNALKIAEGPSGMPGLEAAWLGLLGNGDMYSREGWTTDPDLEPAILDAARALVAPSPTSPSLASIASLPKLDSAVKAVLAGGTQTGVDMATVARIAGFVPIMGQIMGLFIGGLIDKVREAMKNQVSLFNLDPLEKRVRAQIQPPAIAAWAATGNRLRMASVGLASGRLRYVTESGAIVERDGETLAYDTEPPKAPLRTTLLTGMLASASIPAIFRAVQIADDLYVDGGIRMVLPTEVAVRLGATRIFGVQASTRDLDRRPELKNAKLLDIASRALMDVTVNEIAYSGSNRVGSWGNGVEVHFIQPRVDTHDSFTIYPALIRNRMMYGYMCAADVVKPSTQDAAVCEWAADEITVLRHAAARLEAWLESRPVPPTMTTVAPPSGADRAGVIADIKKLKMLVRDRVSVRIQKGGTMPPQNHTWTDHREWWQNWEHHPLRQENSPQVGAHLCALSCMANRLDVFVVSRQQKILHAWWRPDTLEGWEGWYQVQEGMSAPGAITAATSRHPGSIDLVVTGTDGTVFAAQWDQSIADAEGWPGWHGFTPLASGRSAVGGGVAVVSRRPEFLDAFSTGTDGTIWTAAADPSFPSWKGWWQIGTLRSTPAGRISAVSRAQDNLDIFVTDSTGHIRWSHWDPMQAGGWSAWGPPVDGLIKPGQPITAVSRGTGLIDLFIVGLDGHVRTAAFSPSQGWAGWWPIGNVSVPVGAEVAALSPKPNNLDIFVADTGGVIQKSHWEPGLSTWTSWLPLQIGHTTPGASLAVVSRAPGLMDVFFVGTDGFVYTAGFDPAVSAGWRGPWRLHVDVPNNPLEALTITGATG
jgi:NTE family protein